MAVYTELTNEKIAALLETEYDLGTLAFAVGITQGVENTNYLVAMRGADGQETKYILTLYEKRMDPKELPFFIDLMRHLAGRGVSCPKPIARRDGALVASVEGKPAALVSFVEGKSRSQIANAHVASLGTALASLHRATEDFLSARENRLSLAGWQQLYASLEGKLDTISKGLDALVSDELAFLSDAWRTMDLPRGVIHADLFPDNVFFDGDAVSGVIDFYFACTDMLAYDLAITMNAWCFEARGGEFNPIKARLLLTNYQKQRPLNAAEIAAFQTLARGAALRFLLTRAYDWIHREAGANVVVKDPMEYVAKLRFHQQVRSVREYGIHAA